jgi:ornithine lipid ester-linked acyl 2-hydroxylase
MSRHGIYYNITSFTGKSIIRFIESCISIFVKEPPVLDTQRFNWIKELETNYNLIRAEYLAVIDRHLAYDINDISQEQKKVVDNSKWKFFPLYIYGVPINENIALCPETNRLLKIIPDFTTAFFSILSPGTEIKEHRGAFKGYLRYHLGIDIPRDYQKAGIRILEKTYHWQMGKSLVFDDTFLHEAWNKSNEVRTVLYVDFIRPMPAPGRWISWQLTHLISVSPYVKNALNNLKNKDEAEISKVLG